MKPGPNPLTKDQVIERFWKRVDQTKGDDECWPWTGSTTPNGYGLLQARGLSDQPIYTHRFAYEVTIGEIPEGKHVLHRCDNPPCCNPSHFFLGDQQANNKDMISKGRLKIGGNWRRFLH